MRLTLISWLSLAIFLAALSAEGSQIIYVNQNASTGSTQSGTSWGTAYYQLRDALQGAAGVASINNPVEIWVAAGTYKPTAGTDRTQSFALPSYVTIRGGFVGTETSLSQRTTTGSYTVLSGDIGQMDSSGVTATNVGGMLAGTAPFPAPSAGVNNAGFADNSYNVLTCEGSSNVVLDTVIITGGNANNTDANGAQVRTLGDLDSMTTPSLNADTIDTDANATDLGDPLVLPDPVVSGGGIYVTNFFTRSPDQMTLTLDNCVFVHNSATLMGGAIMAYEANLSLTGCHFIANEATQEGGAVGGLDNFYSFENCLFSNNAAFYYGGALYLSSLPSVSNIVSNLSVQQKAAHSQTIGASIKLALSVGKLVYGKIAGIGFSSAFDSSAAFVTADPENLGLNTVVNTAEEGGLGVGDAYSIVGIAMSVGSLAGDMAIAFGGNPNSTAYKGWVQTSDFFNTYLNPVGILTLISDATGGSLGSLTHSPSAEDLQNDYVNDELNDFNAAAYSYVKDCTFQNNNVQGEGGAVVAIFDNVEFDRCWFLTNSAVATAGAVGFIGWNTPRVASCAFSGNLSSNGYSGIFNSFHARSQIMSDTFIGNRSGGAGDAGACVGSELGSAVKVFGSVLWGNTDSGNTNGGADLFVATSQNISANVLSAYNSAGPGQGDYVATLDLRATTVQSFNSLPQGTEEFEIYPWNASSDLINLSEQYFDFADQNGFADLAGYVNLGEGIRPNSFLVIQGQNYEVNDAINPLLTGEGGVVPLFFSPVRYPGGGGSAYVLDFQPLPTITIGDPDLPDGLADVYSGPDTLDAQPSHTFFDIFDQPGDIEGNFDRGCVQYRGQDQQGLENTMIYVKAGATPGGDGESWATAFSDLSPILGNDLFPGGLQVWMAQGTYTNSGILPPGIILYGGFTGTETNLNQRNWVSHPAVFSGQMFCAGTAVLDGLTVANCQGGSYPPIASQESGSELIINNCTFTNNSGQAAGAVYWQGSVTTSNSQFIANSATSGGTGGAINASELTAVNCWFQGNTSTYEGGAVWFNNNISAINCVFSGNNAPQGAAILGENGGPSAWSLYNDTFYGNGAATVAIQGSYDPNNPQFGIEGPAPVPVNCLFWGNVSDGLLPEAADPLFLDAPAQDFELSPNSPDIGTGITNSIPTNFPSIDLAGNPRFVNGRLDPGAYEFQTATGFETQVALSGTNQVFTVLLGTNSTPGSLQWQVNTGNGVWVNVANNSTYSGATSLQLTVSPNSTFYGYQYRLVGVLNSVPVTLPAVGLISAAPSGIFYVRSGATGSGNGSSWQNAYTSMQSIIGDGINNFPIEVWVAKGTYTASGQLNGGIKIYGGFSGTETDVTQRNVTNNPTLFTGYLQCEGNVFLDGLIVTNCRTANGVVFSALSSPTTATVNNCTFINNSNQYSSALQWFGPVAVSNCQFIANINLSGNGGAGIYASEVTAINCLFESNSAPTFSGGAIYAQDFVEAVDCVFVGNHAIYGGSAICANTATASGWNLYNDTFYGNGPAPVLTANVYGVVINPINCLFALDATDSVPTQVFPDLSSDPLFAAPATDNFQLSAYSPAVGTATTNGLPAGFPATDLAGNPRFVNGRLDQGAYEFQGTPLPPPALVTTASPAYLVNGLYGPYFNFSASLGTNPAPTSLQWQVYSNGVWSNVANNSLYQGATGLQLVLYNPAAALTNNQYRLTGIAANGAFFELSSVSLPWTSLATSDAISQTENGGFTSGQWGPLDNLNAALGSAAAGASLQWQVYSNGVWVNVANNSLYQGANSQELTIADPSAALSGSQYRLTGSSTNGVFVLAPVTISNSYPRVLYVDGTRGYSYYTNWVAVHGSAPIYNGTNWSTAFPTLHEALALAQPGAEIWVRSGTYYPLRTLGVDGYPLPAVLSLAHGVRLLGGFTGTETSDTQRNWVAHATIINCTSNAPGDDPSLTEYHYAASPSIFVNGPNVGNDSTVDGFTLTAATAGAVVNQGGSPTIQNCTFTADAAAQGAAVGSWSNASPVIVNCVLSTNVAQQGTLYFNNASGLVENCLLSYNNSFLNGTVYGTNSSVSLLNSAVVFNTASGGTGGVVAAGGGVSLVNSILWGNPGAQLGGSGNATIGYSCVQGGSTTNYNFAIDPVFTLPASNNFQLALSSPLLNNGNAASAAGLSTDLGGNVRELSGLVDVGPYEHQGTAGFAVAATSLPYGLNVTNEGIYSLVASGLPPAFNNIQWQVSSGGAFVPVTNTALLDYAASLSGNNASLNLYLTNAADIYNSLSGLLYRFIEPDLNFTSPPALLTVQIPLTLYVNGAVSGSSANGFSWATAFTNLSQALALSATTNVGSVWLAKGTYALPASSATVKIALYGGFAGVETSLIQRNWTNNVTTLTATGCALSGTLDGFTVQGSTGLANGLAINFASPTIQNCVFSGGNTQVTVNGGLPVFGNCVFSNATTGLLITAGDASITNDTFTMLTNAVTATGNAANAAVSSSIFTAINTAGVQDLAGAAVTVKDSLFTGNTGNSIVHYGSQGGTMSVLNCTFTGNVQPGGAIAAPGAADAVGLQVANCILWNNTSTTWTAYEAANPAIFTPAVAAAYGNADLNEIYTPSSYNYAVYTARALAAANAGQNSTAAADQNLAQQSLAQNAGLLSSVTYNCLQGLSFFNGNNNINDDPLFTNPAGGNYLPGPWSPAQDAGNSSFVSAGDTDLAGNARVYGPAVDLGAYEVQTASLGVIGLIQNPQSVALTVPGATSFTAAIATNSSLANYTWQMNTGSGWTAVVANSVFSFSNNVNATTLIVNPVDLTLNNAQFRLAALPITYAGSAATLTAALGPLAALLNQATTTTAILPAGTDASTYVWQYNSGSGWVTIANGASYAIAVSGNTSTLTILNASPALNGQYRFAAGDGSFTSAPITFTTYVPPVLYVNAAAAAGNGTGTNWNNAINDPNLALSIAQPGEQVWVAAGIYQATNAADAAVTWPLTQGVAVYGGFIGTETSLAQRNWAANATLLLAGWNAAILAGQTSASNTPAVLDGFILTGGNGQPVLADAGALATIQNCVFTNNLFGAISNAGTLVTISNCVFNANTATSGGAILASGGTNVLLACQFLTNSATLEGGAVFAQSTTLNVTNCVFTGNGAGDGGGALNLTGTNIELGLVLSSLTGNTASNGGAIYGNSSNAVNGIVINDLIADNQATGQGGGIDWLEPIYGGMRMYNCTVADNTSVGQGGGLWTGVGNSDAGTLENNIFWGNQTESGDSIEFQQIYDQNFANFVIAAQSFNSPFAYGLEFYDNTIEGLNLFNRTSVPQAGYYVIDVGGNESLDPAFVNAADGNFQLLAYSPAINGGNNNALDNGAVGFYVITNDLAGNPRIYGGIVDMGAYEVQTNQTAPFQNPVLPASQAACDNGSTVLITLGASGPLNLTNAVWQINTGSGFSDLVTGAVYNVSITATGLTLVIQPAALAMNGYQFRLRIPGYAYTTPPATLTVGPETVVYVNAAATAGNNSGTNWANAYTNLAQALSGTSCAQVWVAQGTYTIPVGTNGATSFRLHQFLDLRGGFNGTETSVTQRNYINHPTILAATGGQSIFFDDGTAGPIDQTATLDGFILTGATVNPAIFNLDASPLIRNCVFTNNTARAIDNQGIVTGANGMITNCVFSNNPGGGILNIFSAPAITGCSFVSNNTEAFGGGMDNEQGGPSVINCVFTGNTANTGGGFYNNTTNAGTTLLRDTFTGNTASQAGALDNTAGSVLTVRDSLLAQNSAFLSGGAIYDSGVLIAVNDTIADNTAGYAAGGVWVDSGATFNAGNSILWNNTVNTPGAGLLAAQITGATPETILAGVSNSIVEGLSGASANGNVAYDPLFDNESAGEYQLTGVSPAVDAGNTNTLLAGELDLAGNTREQRAAVDLGAYEYLGSPATAAAISLVPQSVNACASNNIVFTVAAPVADSDTYTWQQQSGANFTNLSSNAIYTIATTNGVGTLDISNVSAGLTGSAYRVLVQDGSEVVTSAVFTLTANPRSVIYVNSQAAPGGDGASWSRAFVNLADAVGQGNCSDIWIAQGTYTPTNDTTGQPVTLQLAEGMRLFGGFAGTETNLAQRNPAMNRTILTGPPGTVTLEALGTATPIDQSTLLNGLFITGLSGAPAVLLSGASPLFQNCVFTTNSADAVSCQGAAAPAFVNCAFSNNIGASAVLAQGASPSFVNCIFAGNEATAGQSGGAISAESGSALSMLQCTLTNNTAAAAGGAVSVDQSSAIISSSLLADNSAGTAGAISGTDEATLTLINDTMADNSAPVVGGVAVSGQGYVTNCILWDNGNSEAAQLSGTVAVAYSDIEDLNLFAGNDNIPYDPLFVNTAAGEFTLQSGSPGVDTGDNGAVDSSLDVAGAARIQGFSVDMGAYESAGIGQYIQVTQQPVSQTGCEGSVVRFVVAGPANFGSNFIWQVNTGSGFAPVTLAGNDSVITNGSTSILVLSNADVSLSGYQYRAAIGNLGLYSSVATLTVLPHGIIYVNAAATGSRSGATWANAYTNLDPALAAADQCTEIWVAQGTYASTNRAAGPGFVLASGAAVYGGFAGTETNRTQRNWIANPTRLTSAGQTNVLQIVSSGIVDGFIVTGTNVTSGVYIASSVLPTVQNCTFLSNAAPAVVNAGGTPSILNCAFETNTATALINSGGSAATVSNCVFIANSGGAILNQASSLTVQQSTFTANTATLGGALYAAGSSPLVLLDHCTFASNNATADGGAVYNDVGGNLSVVDGLFHGNTAQNGGGLANNGQAIVLSSTFSENNANLAGGGIYGAQGSVAITNSILWDDSAAAAPEWSGSVSVWYSLVQNGANPGSSATAASDFSYDPQFVNPAAGNFGLPAFSPAVGAGYVPAAAGIATDLAGNARVDGWGLDLGAYQSGSSPHQTVTVSDEPVGVSACAGQLSTSLTYTAPATNSAYEWLLNNGGWQVLANGQTGPASETYFIATVTNGGFVTSTLTIANVVAGMNGFEYAIGNGASFLSAPATLTVTAPAVIYLNAAAAPGGNGTSWATAFNNLPAAFSAAAPCQSVIWVAAGTYSASNLPSGSFQVPYVHGGIALYGGFAGTETALAQRNWTNNLTVLTGAPGDPVVNLNGSLNTIDTNTVLDGFTLIGDGGIGIAVSLASPVIANCTIESNAEGGVVVSDGSPVLENDQILANTGSMAGGLTVVSNTMPCAPLIEDCTFQNNGGSLAGAIYMDGATPTFADVLVNDNADVAIVLSNSPASLINATVAGNSNGLVSIGAPVNVYNSIFWDNGAAGTNVELGQLDGDVSVANSCVQGLNLYAGNGNIGNDPLFLAEVAPAQAPTMAGDYHLYASSPAIGAGNPGLDGLIGFDLAGNPRLVNGGVDMGAYEFAGTAVPATSVAIPPATTAYSYNAVTIYATVTGTGLTYQWQGNFGQGWVNLTDGANYSGSATYALTILNPTLLLNGAQYRVSITDSLGAATVSPATTVSVISTVWYVSPTGTNGGGQSWATAFNTVQAALASLAPGVTNSQVWVAAGAYYADPADTNASIQLPSDVTLLGGFAGTETSASQRNWAAHRTILEGALPDGGNSVLLLSAINQAGVTLDGFVLQDARLSLAETNSDLALANCVFNGDGQAISAEGGTVSLVACTVSNTLNTGIEAVNLQDLNATVANSLFAGNPGTAVVNSNSVVVITGCVFTNNAGIGIYNGALGTVNIEDTLFVNNGIGSYSDAESYPAYEDCTFAGNTHGLWVNNVNVYGNPLNNFAFIYSFALVDDCWFLTNNDSALINHNSTVLVSRSQFRGNQTTAYGGALSASGGSLLVIDSLFSGNYAALGGGAIYQVIGTDGEFGGDIQLNNCTVADNGSAGPGAGFYSAGATVTLENSIFWGNYGPDGYAADAQFAGDANTFFENVNQDNVENAGGVDPAFVAPQFGGGANAPTSAGDYHLGGDSPLVGAGALGYVNDGSSFTYSNNVNIATDLDGNPRVNNSTVDLGAYEFQGALPATALTITGSPGALVYYPGVASHNVLSVSVTGTGLGYQWYADFNDGRGFVALTDGTNFTGTTTATLTFGTVPADLNGVQFMVLVTSSTGGAVYTTPAPFVINPSRWYVNPTAPAGGNGLSWATAFNDLSPALSNPNLTPADSEIWVAQGAYSGPWTVPNGVALIGGFAGDETDPSQRNVSANPTVLSSQVSLQEGDILDGFTITNAYYSVYYSQGYSGVDAPLIANCVLDVYPFGYGIQSDAVDTTNSLVVTNCQIYGGYYGLVIQGPLCMYDCTVSNYSYAGAEFNHATPSTNVFENCVFAGPGYRGAGLLENANTSAGYPDYLDHCVIANNAWGFQQFGPGMNLFVTNCLFSANGILATNATAASLVLDHTIMTNNYPATIYGGSITNLLINGSLIAGNEGSATSPIYDPTNRPGITNIIVIKDSTIAGNYTESDAGAIDAKGGTVLLTNSIVWDNSSNFFYGVIYAAVVAGSNNCVQSTLAGGANVSIDPLFVNTNQGNYHLSNASQVRAAGNPALTSDTLDLDGNPRLAGGEIDLGPYQTGVTYSFAQLKPVTGVGFEINLTGTLGSYSVLRSTNLVTWSIYGVFTSQGSGNFQFIDTNELIRPQGFYRVTSP